MKVLWVESGLAWIPFLMQRLDHEYQMRTCEAPLLKRLPSEYMRDMFYTSQPLEKTNMKLLQATMECFNADTQLLYASDWPHWDLPGEVGDANLARVLTAAVRLYAAKRDGATSAPEPVEADKITPTEIVVTVSDLIRAAGLNLWDVSMWFNRSGR
jgi:hypothetical protein